MDIQQYILYLCQEAVVKHASDIHFHPQDKKIIIKFRIYSELYVIEEISLSDYLKLNSLLKYRAKLDISEKRKAQSGQFELEINKENYAFRVSTLPLNEQQEAIVIRVLFPNLTQCALSIFKEQAIKIEQLINYQSGLILFVGPTGSGKSSTLYQLALKLACNQQQVISIEDPIEINLKEILQVQFNEKAGRTYANVIKSILRCDPDVIIIGEIRDAETAICTIQAALSGHLVLSTLHAEDGKGALEKLLEFGISKTELKQGVKGIVAQRLVKLINDNEKQGIIAEVNCRKDIIGFLDDHQLLTENLSYWFDKAVKYNYISLEDMLYETM